MWLKRFYWYFDLRKITVTSSVIIVIVLAILPFITEKQVRYLPCQVHPSAHDHYRFQEDNSGLPFHEEIVPNIVHFYRTGKDVNYIGFVDAVCLLSAFRFINPDKIIIHTEDVLAVTNSFSKSSFGKRLKQVPGFNEVLDIQHWPAPKHVFGIEFSSIYRNNHISDVTRLRIIRKHGGIFLDNHAFVLKKLDYLRNYEMSVLTYKDTVSNKVIVGHRDSRMLNLWLKSYHSYNSSVPIHHHTNDVRLLFLQKSSLYHRFENSVQQENINVLTDLDKLQKLDNHECYVVYINVPNLKTDIYQNDELRFNSENVINVVERQVSKQIPGV